MRAFLLLVVLGALTLPASAGAIVGGQPATRAYPHMGELLYDAAGSGQDYEFICGSSLVAPDLVLTAAHCVTDDGGGVVPAASLKVVLGTHKRSQASAGETIGVTSVAREPEYDASTGSYDIALLRLEHPAREAPVRVAGASDRALWTAGAKLTVTGWGAQASPDPAGLTLSDDLREVGVTAQSDADCAQYAVLMSFDPKTMLCAGETVGGKDACQGDSGGPLMSIGAGDALTLVGVVSQGTGCGYPTQYGVYARVGEGPLRAWLDAQLPPPPAASSPPAKVASTAPVRPTGKAKATNKPKAKRKPKAKHKKKRKAKPKRRTKRTRQHKRTKRHASRRS